MNLVEIYVNYIKQQGTFDFGLDDYEKTGLSDVLESYELEEKYLTKKEKELLDCELKQLAEENDHIRDFEKLNQGD